MRTNCDRFAPTKTVRRGAKDTQEGWVMRVHPLPCLPVVGRQGVFVPPAHVPQNSHNETLIIERVFIAGEVSKNFAQLTAHFHSCSSLVLSPWHKQSEDAKGFATGRR